MTTPPLTDQQRADIITRHHHTTDPEACGTCRDLTTARKPAIHPECLRRATLTPAWDAPDVEDLADMTDEERAALPARFHTPVYVESSTPKAWLCAVCWGDGWVTSWPCETATTQGHRVFVPERYAGQSQQDMGALLTDRDRLAAELDAARRSAKASEESATILQRAWDAQAAELDARTADLAAMTDLRDRAIARQDQLREQLAQAQQQPVTCSTCGHRQDEHDPTERDCTGGVVRRCDCSCKRFIPRPATARTAP